MKSMKPKMKKMGGDMEMSTPRFVARAMRPGGMKKGGPVHSDAAMDKKLIRKEIDRAEKMEDKGMKKGGAIMAIKDTPTGRKMAGAAMGAKKYAKGGGIEMKGKTKGRVV